MSPINLRQRHRGRHFFKQRTQYKLPPIITTLFIKILIFLLNFIFECPVDRLDTTAVDSALVRTGHRLTNDFSGRNFESIFWIVSGFNRDSLRACRARSGGFRRQFLLQLPDFVSEVMPGKCPQSGDQLFHEFACFIDWPGSQHDL